MTPAVPPRRIVVTVCRREPGVVTLPIERGRRPKRLDAEALAHQLEALVARRGLRARVRVEEGCAGGCAADGPNLSVTVFTVPPPGQPEDHVAIAWRTYVGALDTLDCLARVVEENLGDVRPRAARTATRRIRSARR